MTKWHITSGFASVGVWLADSFVGFWKFVARLSLGVSPPERQAGRMLYAILEQRIGIENFTEKLPGIYTRDKSTVNMTFYDAGKANELIGIINGSTMSVNGIL
jgi:hypothetical protein